MLSARMCCASRISAVAVLAIASLILSGCPGSNYSSPSLASPQTPQQPSTPPVTTPPPSDVPTVTPPPGDPQPSDPPPATSAPADPAPTVLPTATDGTLTTSVGTAKTGVLIGTGTALLSYAIIVPTLSGTAKLIDPSNGTFTYAPNPHFSGTDRLQFTVTDSVGTSKPASVTITVSPLAIGALSAPANIGVNVEGVSYYNVAEQYVDLIYMGSEWQASTSTRNLAQTGGLDADGWPTEDAVIMFVSTGVANGSAADPGPDSYLLGTYKLSFNGIAKLHNNGGAVADQHYDAATNTTTATLVPARLGSGGTTAQVRVYFNDSQRTASSPIDTGVTNVHVIRPQFAPNGVKWWDSPTQKFTNPFLASLAPFSTLRFMDWTHTNGNQQTDWSQRTPANWPGASPSIQTDGAWIWNSTDHKVELTDNYWSGTGGSWESVIELANVTGKDIWINIPIRATDDYVKSLATLLKQKLNPGIHVYVEYSNEIWNYGFEQWNYNDAATKALLANDPVAAANYAKDCMTWATTACHVAERLLAISNDFASVWGSAAINDTIRPVFAWQTGSTAMQVAMAFINNVYGPPSKYFYAVASAPYWHPPAIVEGDSVDQLLASPDISYRDGTLLIYTVTARYYGLHSLTYEGGPGMSGTIDLPNMIAANADPRMGQQVTDALTGAFQNGVDMYVYYAGSGAWSKYGMWGATNDVFDLAQPKWLALKTLSGKSITRTLAVVDPLKNQRAGTTLPGTIDVAHPSFGVIAGALQPGGKTIGGACNLNSPPAVCSLKADPVNGNAQFGYMVVVPQAGTYKVTLQLDGRSTTNAASAQFYVNQQAQGGVITIAASPSGTASKPAAFSVTLPAGIVLLELEGTSGTFLINSIVVAAAN